MADEGVLHLGPRNNPLLTLQNQHVSSIVWNNKPETPDRILKLRKPRNWCNGVPHQIEEHLQTAGFYEVSMIRNIILDKTLISAMVERWRPETHTFHMPFGECTITLEDVAVQLGLNIDGLAVIGVTSCDWGALVEHMLGKAPPATGALKGSTLKMSWLNSEFDFEHLDADDPVETANYARAYMLMLIGSILLSDHSGSHVPLRYLPQLMNFEETSTYSWGSAVLATLYHELCYATNHRRGEIGGCMLLIQLWAWERIREFPPRIQNIQLNLPLAARWVAPVKIVKTRDIRWYRHKLDTLKTTEFVWMPYSDIVLQSLAEKCRANNHLWRAVVPMICFNMVEWHQPDRVMQQFGMQQDVPRKPSQNDKVHDMSLTGKEDWNWVELLHAFIDMWLNREGAVVSQPPLTRLASHNDDYMRWYSEHSVRWLTREVAATGQMAERIHIVHHGLSRVGRGLHNAEELKKHLERCLTLIDHIDSITIPSASVPPLAMEVPQPIDEMIPTLGNKEGEGLARKRATVLADVVPIPDVTQPPPDGAYYLYPPYVGDSFMPYHYGAESSYTQPNFYAGGTSGSQMPESQPFIPSQPMYHGSQPYEDDMVTPMQSHGSPNVWPSPSASMFMDIPEVSYARPQQYNVDPEEMHNAQVNFDPNLNNAFDAQGRRINPDRQARHEH